MRLARLATAFVVAALVAVPMFAARGSADFRRFVAIGDSYGAGFESGSLNERHQVWSWPAVVARQAGLDICPPTATAADPCWAVPLVSFPGFANELVLVNLAPTIAPAPGSAQPLMPNFARPYNNLSIPGATIGAVLTLTGAETPSANEPTAVGMARFILRGQGTVIQQALVQQPTFIALWLGGNDYLNVIFSGNPATVTSAADFKTRYEAVLNSLVAGAPNAGMVVGNLPTGLVPYLTLVPPFLVDPATRTPILDPDGNLIFFIADLGGGVFGPVPPTTLIPLHTRDKLAQGFGLPPAFKNFPPFDQLPHTGEPLTANDIITAEELAAVTVRVGEFNTIIQQAAAARDIPVADVASLFTSVALNAQGQGGLHLGPITVSNAFITGGFFSLDGFHLTDLGYLLLGNEFIKAINEDYDTEIPLASIAQLFANNGAFFPETADGQLVFSTERWSITDDAVKQILNMWAPKPAPKRRVVSH